MYVGNIQMFRSFPLSNVKVLGFVVICTVCIYLFAHNFSNSNESISVSTVSNSNEHDSFHELKFHGNVTWVKTALQCGHLQRIKGSIAINKPKIWGEWNVSHFPNFLTMMHVPQSSWELQKAKFIEMLLNVDQFRHNNRSFVVGFSGSSVTAGHDNYFSEAYPNVFKEAILPVMRVLLADNSDNSSALPSFVVRNHALGNNPCYPYDACVASHLGEDLDILTWEQSMNCGRASRPVDTFCRAAHRMHKKPTVMFLLSGGPTWTADSCSAFNTTASTSSGVVRTAPLSEAESATLRSPLRQAVHEAGHMDKMEFLKDETATLSERFVSLAPMGQNIFGAEAYKCLGPYSSTFSWKTPGGGVSWHPGRLGHKLRGDNLAYTLMSILEDAVLSTEAAVCSISGDTKSKQVAQSAVELLAAVNNSSTLRKAQQKEPEERQDVAMPCNETMESTLRHAATGLSLPLRPKVVSGILAQLAESARVHKVGDKGALSSGTALALTQHYIAQAQSLALPAVPPSYGVDETNAAPICYTSYQPRMSHDLAAQVVSRLSSWTLDLAVFDKAAVAKSEKRHFGYLDRKNVFTSSGQGSRIAIRISVGKAASGSAITHYPLWLCELQKGFLKYPASMTDLDSGAEVSADRV